MNRKLSTPRSRSELIADFGFGKAALAEAPADTDTPLPSAGEAEENPVSEAIDKLKDAVAAAQAAQAKDPDDKTDPDDKPVDDDLTKIAELVDELEKAQAADVADEPPTPKPSTAPTKDEVPPAASSAANTASLASKNAPDPTEDDGTGSGPLRDIDDQIDEDGNVNPKLKCANPDCGHMAASPQDMPEGDNTGLCEMEGCTCQSMTVDEKQLQDDEDDEGGGPDNEGGGTGGEGDPATQINDQTATKDGESFADAAVPVESPVPDGSDTTPAPAAEGERNLPPELPGGDSMGPAFTIPVAVILGQDTGDGRIIALDALDWRVPPLPLMGLATATHDPSGIDQNDPAVICGRIDSLEYGPGEDGTQVIIAKGYYLPNDDGMYFAEMTEAMGRCGISADVAVADQEMSGELDDDGMVGEIGVTVTKGTIMGLTQCPYPAFQGAYVVLGDGSDAPAPVAQQTDEDSAATDELPSDGLAAAGVHWMSYEECVPCAQGIEVVVASGAGPMRPPASWFDDPGFHIGDERLREIAPTKGNFGTAKKYACPLTVTEDGRIFGHIAPWGICHTGSAGTCIVPPRSKVGYAHFMRGQILTAEGTHVPVGVITADTGHAPTQRGVSPARAMAHYDDTGFQAADVAMGEDDFGIWVAGAVRPDVTEGQLRMLRASSYSGDWRNMGGGLEMVALLAVNQPGFPVAVVASGHVESLVASGASVMFQLRQDELAETIADSSVDVALRTALAPLLEQMKTGSRNRMLSLTARQAKDRMVRAGLRD